MANRSYQDDRLAALKNPSPMNYTKVHTNPTYPKASVIQPDISANYLNHTNQNRSHIYDNPPNHIASSQYINPNGSYQNANNSQTPGYNNHSYNNSHIPRNPYKSTYIDPNISATLGGGVNLLYNNFICYCQN